MYGSNDMYLSPQKSRRRVWTKAQLEARKKLLLPKEIDDQEGSDDEKT